MCVYENQARTLYGACERSSDLSLLCFFGEPLNGKLGQRELRPIRVRNDLSSVRNNDDGNNNNNATRFVSNGPNSLSSEKTQRSFTIALGIPFLRFVFACYPGPPFAWYCRKTTRPYICSTSTSLGQVGRCVGDERDG